MWLFRVKDDGFRTLCVFSFSGRWSFVGFGLVGLSGSVRFRGSWALGHDLGFRALFQGIWGVMGPSTAWGIKCTTSGRAVILVGFREFRVCRKYSSITGRTSNEGRNQSRSKE